MSDAPRHHPAGIEPPKPQPDPFAAEGAVFARLIENNR